MEALLGVEGGRVTGVVAGAGRVAYLAGACVVGALRVERAHRAGGRPAAVAKFRQIAGEFCEIFGVEVRLDGRLDEQAREVRVANHTTYLDIFALNSVGAGRFLSMAQVAGWPLVGLVARHIGTVFVDRDSKDGRASGLRALCRAVAAPGAPVVVFPEGRTCREGVLPFARGAFLAARSEQLAVRPLALVYDDRAAASWVGDEELLPHVWRRLCGPPLRCTIKVLAPLPFDEDADPQALADEARLRIAAEIGYPDNQ
jgi:1-acyl-sn-glycerol-3-phosphate acyltransferase